MPGVFINSPGMAHDKQPIAALCLASSAAKLNNGVNSRTAAVAVAVVVTVAVWLPKAEAREK